MGEQRDHQLMLVEQGLAPGQDKKGGILLFALPHPAAVCVQGRETESDDAGCFRTDGGKNRVEPIPVAAEDIIDQQTVVSRFGDDHGLMRLIPVDVVPHELAAVEHDHAGVALQAQCREGIAGPMPFQKPLTIGRQFHVSLRLLPERTGDGRSHSYS